MLKGMEMREHSSESGIRLPKWTQKVKARVRWLRVNQSSKHQHIREMGHQQNTGV